MREWLTAKWRKYGTFDCRCAAGYRRRAELQNKPSWGAVPSHANWLAQDAAGSWLWHSSEPECRNGGWIGSTTRGYAAKGCVIGDWRDTLEKRPDMHKTEPKIDTVSEHVHKTEESMHDWFERGELPPVGVVCEAYIDYPPQWVGAEIVAHKDGFAICWCNSVMKGCHGDKASEFRPIRTEHEQLTSIIDGGKRVLAEPEAIADAILAAGFSLRAK